MSNEEQIEPSKSKIILPSLKEVQAAQRARPAPNLFIAKDQAAAENSIASTATASVAESTPIPRNSIGRELSLEEQQRRGQVQNAIQHRAEPIAERRQCSTSYLPTGHDQREGGLPSISGSSHLAAHQVVTAAHRCVSSMAQNALLVSRKQNGNPVLKHIRHVRWAFDDIVPDYIMGPDACAIFISMKFHLLKPEYIHYRIKELQRSFRLRVLLCHIDSEDVTEPLQQITRAAIINDMTLICGWSPEECGRYLESFKAYAAKPADALMGRVEEDHFSRLTAVLTAVRGVNRTDVHTLGAAFRTGARIMQASHEDLVACPGLGPTKARRLHAAFHEPFRRALSAAPMPTSPGDPISNPPEGAVHVEQTESSRAAAASQPLVLREEIPADDSDDDEYIL